MFSNLSPAGKEKSRELEEISQRNNDFRWLLFDYLNNDPCLITKELIESICSNNTLPEEAAYSALLTGFFGLDIENNERDRQLANEYLRPSVKKLDPDTYTQNPYYRNIRIPKKKFGSWELTYLKYRPYEAFIYNDLIIEPDFKEIPRIGYFDKEFRFPAVLENDREWMAIKPNEIETMNPVIEKVKGRVVTFGLGLGYFAYMASLKDDVREITVVERDREVIRLFETIILPQFQYKEKIRIISAEAFEYAEKQMTELHFDYAFVDLWHDVSDGLEIYLKMKKIEILHERTKFYYWIEDSLLSGVRWKERNGVSP